MERNFRIWNGRPPNPMRSCRKRMGLPDSSQMASAAILMMGREMSRKIREARTSSIRFAATKSADLRKPSERIIQLGDKCSRRILPSICSLTVCASSTATPANFRCKSSRRGVRPRLSLRESTIRSIFSRAVISSRSRAAPIMPGLTNDLPMFSPSSSKKTYDFEVKLRWVEDFTNLENPERSATTFKKALPSGQEKIRFHHDELPAQQEVCNGVE